MTRSKFSLFYDFFCAVLLFCLISCGSTNPGKNKKPEDLVSKDTMAQMLVRIHLAEGKSSVLSVSKDSAKKVYNLMEQDIYSGFRVSPQKFRKSYEYYLRDLDAMKTIYEQVEDSLKAREKKHTGS